MHIACNVPLVVTAQCVAHLAAGDRCQTDKPLLGSTACKSHSSLLLNHRTMKQAVTPRGQPEDVRMVPEAKVQIKACVPSNIGMAQVRSRSVLWLARAGLAHGVLKTLAPFRLLAGIRDLCAPAFRIWTRSSNRVDAPAACGAILS
jgi:hypothetical protein